MAPESSHSSSFDTSVQIDFVDANDPILFVGKRLTENEKFSLPTVGSKAEISKAFIYFCIA